MASETVNPKQKTVIAFDLYGTILSTSSVAVALSKQLGISDQKAAEVATLWRRYQLEYSWRLSCMKKYMPFSTVTLNSLYQALLDLSIALPRPISSTDTFEKTILQSYNALKTFPDAIKALQDLSTADTLIPYIFSNGTSSMLQASVHESPGLKDHAHLLKGIISVEETGKFKPCPEVYHHLARVVLGLPDSHEPTVEEVGRIWLVSGNPFDVLGAKAVGMRAVWIDREEKGWNDRLLGLGKDGSPDLIAKGVDDAVQQVKVWHEKGNVD